MRKRYFLYEIINKFPESTISELNEKTGWKLKKIKHLIGKLYDDGMIKIKIYPKKWEDLINWDEMENIKKENR